MAEETEPRWLSPEQQSVWRSWLLAVARIEDYLDRDLRRFGLSLAEYEILVRLSEADGWSLRMSQLADDVHQTRSRLTHTISRMEREGLVSRHSAPDDRRGVLAQLTEKGYDLLVEAAPSHVAAVRRILVDVTDPKDFAAMGRALDAVLTVAD